MLEQARNTQRHSHETSPEELRLVADITTLATRYGRYGYRRITALLQDRGWQVNHKRVEIIWRQEGLKVPQKQPKRGRLWLNDGSCIRLRPEHKDHVWSYDFMVSRTADGRAFKLLTILDEYTRECLAILVERRITAQDVIDQLFNLFVLRGIPEHIRLNDFGKSAHCSHDSFHVTIYSALPVSRSGFATSHVPVSPFSLALSSKWHIAIPISTS